MTLTTYQASWPWPPHHAFLAWSWTKGTRAPWAAIVSWNRYGDWFSRAHCWIFEKSRHVCTVSKWLSARWRSSHQVNELIVLSAVHIIDWRIAWMQWSMWSIRPCLVGDVSFCWILVIFPRWNAHTPLLLEIFVRQRMGISWDVEIYAVCSELEVCEWFEFRDVDDTCSHQAMKLMEDILRMHQ